MSKKSGLLLVTAFSFVTNLGFAGPGVFKPEEKKWSVFHFDVKSLNPQVTKKQCEEIFASAEFRSIELNEIRKKKSHSETWYTLGPDGAIGMAHDSIDFKLNGKVVSATINSAVYVDYSKHYTAFAINEVEGYCSAKAHVVPDDKLETTSD